MKRIICMAIVALTFVTLLASCNSGSSLDITPPPIIPSQPLPILNWDQTNWDESDWL
jgi:hypothetical protein